MKTIFISIGFIFISSLSSANEDLGKDMMPQIMLQTAERDTSLDINQSKYEFIFRNINLQNDVHRVIQYSIDGASGVKTIGEKQEIEIITTPGNHIFQFYYDDVHYEVYSDSLFIEPGFKNVYTVHFTDAKVYIQTEKPVLYVYPTVETEVTLKVDVKGKPFFMYPTYKDKWEFTATPHGDLKIGQNTYAYLFWESEQRMSVSELNQQEGFIIRGSEVVESLENILTEAGLNSKEQADFITYW